MRPYRPAPCGCRRPGPVLAIRHTPALLHDEGGLATDQPPRNYSALLSALPPAASQAPKQPAAAFAADGGDKREDDFFGQLSYCMQRVHVVEEQLHLAMSLSVLSGNGSFDEYEDLFKDKCQRTFAYAWLVDSIYDYTGASYAYDEWNENTWTGEAIAITIAVANLVALACCCAALYTCVKRGYCYRICSPSSKEERAGLRDTDIKCAAPALPVAHPATPCECTHDTRACPSSPQQRLNAAACTAGRRQRAGGLLTTRSLNEIPLPTFAKRSPSRTKTRPEKGSLLSGRRCWPGRVTMTSTEGECARSASPPLSRVFAAAPRRALMSRLFGAVAHGAVIGAVIAIIYRIYCRRRMYMRPADTPDSEPAAADAAGDGNDEVVMEEDEDGYVIPSIKDKQPAPEVAMEGAPAPAAEEEPSS